MDADVGVKVRVRVYGHSSSAVPWSGLSHGLDIG